MTATKPKKVSRRRRQESPSEGVYLALAPDEGRSFWQPVPANGHVTVKVEPATTGLEGVSMSVQAVGPGGHVREHAHGENDEIIFVVAGRGTAVIGGNRHAMVPGTTFFLGRGVRHTFVNDGEAELTFTATLMPAGLERYFEAVGRPRRPGEPVPAPFARPANVLEIERNTVFKDPK